MGVPYSHISAEEGKANYLEYLGLMSKERMLETLDSLLACLRGKQKDIEDLVAIQLERMDDSELEAYYKQEEYSYYLNNPESFKDDYYWEFTEPFFYNIGGELYNE